MGNEPPGNRPLEEKVDDETMKRIILHSLYREGFTSDRVPLVHVDMAVAAYVRQYGYSVSGAYVAMEPMLKKMQEEGLIRMMESHSCFLTEEGLREAEATEAQVHPKRNTDGDAGAGAAKRNLS